MTRLPNVTPTTAAAEMEWDLSHFPSYYSGCKILKYCPSVLLMSRSLFNDLLPAGGFANRTPEDNMMPSKVFSEPR
jgi:hypothetical protein